MVILAALAILQSGWKSDLAYFHGLAHEVADSARVAPGDSISGGVENTTGKMLRVPGGTRNYYPAFWVRDAAMMLGADLVPADEVKGWVEVVAATQPGPEGLSFDHGLRIPPYSIPDHITLQGAACWFPGAYADQGVGNCGHLPPADDAFYFIQMVDEVIRQTHDLEWLQRPIQTGWGRRSVIEVAERAFDSVAVDQATGLVDCSADDTKDRRDWGFCDAIRKSGLCLMPSLLRLQAAWRLAGWERGLNHPSVAVRYAAQARLVAASIPKLFERRIGDRESMLLSATITGRKDDVWAEAFAAWLHVLPHDVDRRVLAHLAALYQAGGTVLDGQIRQLPPDGNFGGSWSPGLGLDSYQNGGFWATPTGWYAAALRRLDARLAEKLLHEYAEFVRANRKEGAPFEWIGPFGTVKRNPNYGSSAGLVYIAVGAN